MTRRDETRRRRTVDRSEYEERTVAAAEKRPRDIPKSGERTNANESLETTRKRLSDSERPAAVAAAAVPVPRRERAVRAPVRTHVVTYDISCC